MSKPKQQALLSAEGSMNPEPDRDPPSRAQGVILYTIGHSNRALEEFLELVLQHQILQLVDIRTLPGSRSYPHFDKERLSGALSDVNIAYRHLPELGGRRRPNKDSLNTGWRHPAFRGYADYMQTDTFRSAAERLAGLARACTTAIMCAEAVPWRCHRSLVGDAMLVRGFEVIDIISRTSARPHTLTDWARVDGLDVAYPAAQAELPL